MKYRASVLKRLFRHPLSAFYYLTVQLAAIFAFFSILSVYISALQYEKDAKAFSYKEEGRMKIRFSDGFSLEDLTKIRFDQDVQVSFEPFYTNVDGTELYSQVTVWLSLDGNGHYQMLKGALPEMEMEAAVGRYYQKYLYEKNNFTYIKLQGNEYRVSGIIGCAHSDFLDMELVIPFCSLTAEQTEALSKNNTVNLRIQSDGSGLAYSLQDIYEQLTALNPDLNIQVSSAQKREIYSSLTYEHMMLFYTIFFLCIIVSILVSYYWIKEREREIAVRKAFGQSALQLFCMLSKEAMLLNMIALTVYGLACFLLSRDTVYIVLYWMSVNTVGALLFMIFLVFQLAGVIILPTLKMISIQPAQKLNNKE